MRFVVGITKKTQSGALWLAPLWLGALSLAAASAGALSLGACKSDDPPPGPSVPASADPEGDDLVEGAIVAATEASGGVRLYKIKKVNWFPAPVGEELVMLAFREKGNDFVHAAKLFEQRDLTVALPNVRVRKHNFLTRDYRVLDEEPVTDVDRALEAEAKLPPKLSPGEAHNAQAKGE